jgi:uncharacterized protein (DUF885 family)
MEDLTVNRNLSAWFVQGLKFALLCALPLTTAAAEESDRESFDRVLARDWQWQMTEYPEWATHVGFPGQNARWTNWTRSAVEARQQRRRQLLSLLKHISPDTLSESERLNRDLFLYETELEVEGFRFPDELLGITQLNGLQVSMPRTFKVMPHQTTSDYRDILSRLQGVASLVRQQTALLEEGLKQGVTPPRITLRDVPDQVLKIAPDTAEKSPLMVHFAERPEAISESEWKELHARALKIYDEQVLPALRVFHTFLVERYLPGARESLAAQDLPDGEAWYAWLVKSRTTTAMNPNEIHALGMREVARIRAEMEVLIVESGFEDDFAAFTDFLREDPRFYFETPEALLEGYRQIAKRADAALPALFGTLPRSPYEILAVPAHSEKSLPTAYYQTGSEETGRPGYFYANTYKLRSRPKWGMTALALHEAVPGHHLQTSLAQENDDLPEFRKHGGFTAFIEGWGLYAESLGAEMGLYDDLYAKFGQLSYEMWRAIRLVLDTGIHAKGWGRQQAIDFFRENSGKPEHDILVEVDRYIAWPGQALAYKIGELEFKQLRAKAAAALGAKFDVRVFHDEVLSAGALPLKILEERIEQWIARQKAS